MRIFVFSILFFCFSSSFSQKLWIRKSIKAYDYKKYQKVVRFTNKVAYSALPDALREMRANAYLFIRDYPKALHAFDNLDMKIVQSDSMWLNYAKVLEYNGQYQKALEYYKKYNANHPLDKLSLAHMEACSTPAFLQNNSQKVLINPYPYNTEENDFVGFLIDSNLVFVSGGYARGTKQYHWDGQHFLNYYSVKSSGLGAVPEIFSSSLQTKLHEGPGFFDHHSQTLYFTRNSIVHKENATEESISNLKIYSSVLKNKRWTKIQELEFNDDIPARFGAINRK